MEYFNWQILGTQEEKAIIKSHVILRGETLSVWVREAIITRLAAEGVYLDEQMARFAKNPRRPMREGNKS